MKPLLPTDPPSIGRYRLYARLGAGGMGQVYLAHTPSGRTVVVKVIRPEHADDVDFRARFAREAEAARRVGGFHTAQVVDSDSTADQPWIATAHIPGLSLQQLVQTQGPLQVPELRALASGLAEGLEAIHACGLVHRDLKPANIIMADDGPRIIDFGIARPLDASGMTQTGMVIGTLSYMSPEQAQGHPVSPASDVFSLGTVLAFAATGANPFAADTMATIVLRIISPPPNVDELPEELRPLVRSCWNHEPDGRPSLEYIIRSWGDNKTPLPAPHVFTASINAPNPPPQYTTPHSTKRYETALKPQQSNNRSTSQTSHSHKTTPTLFEKISRRTLLLALTSFLTPTLIFSGIHFWPDRVIDLESVTFEIGRSYTLAFSPDGSIIASGGPDGVIQILDLESKEVASSLNDNERSISSLDFNPEGTMIASGGRHDTIRLWNVESGEPERTLTGHSDYVNSVEFSPDGETLASGSKDETVRFWDPSSGENVSTTTYDGNIYSVAFNQQGTNFASSGFNGIQISDTETEDEERLPDYSGLNYALAFSPNESILAIGTSEGTVHLHDISSNENHVSFEADHIIPIQEHLWRDKVRFYSVDFSPDGSMVAAGGSDHTVRLWDVENEEPIGALRGHERDVRSVAFSPDGETLASASLDGTIRVWSLP